MSLLERAEDFVVGTMTFPLINYTMNRRGVLRHYRELTRSERYPQERLQAIQLRLGRTGEVFFTRDGRMLAPNFWMRTFMVGRQSQTIERWQVHYRKDRSIQLRLVPRPTFSPDTEADLRRHLEKNLSTATPVDFEYVAQIDRHPSGKDMLIINDATDP